MECYGSVGVGCCCGYVGIDAFVMHVVYVIIRKLLLRSAFAVPSRFNVENLDSYVLSVYSSQCAKVLWPFISPVFSLVLLVSSSFCSFSCSNLLELYIADFKMVPTTLQMQPTHVDLFSSRGATRAKAHDLNAHK